MKNRGVHQPMKSAPAKVARHLVETNPKALSQYESGLDITWSALPTKFWKKHNETSTRNVAVNVIATTAALVLLAGCAATTQGSHPSGATPSPSTSGSPSAQPPTRPTERSRTVYYLSPGHVRGSTVFHDTVTLVSRRGADPPERLGTFKADGARSFEMTVTVSPDGSRVAWLSNTHELVTSKVDGSDRRTLAAGLPTPTCFRPIWTPDSNQIIFPGTLNGPAQIINVNGTARKSLRTPYPCWHVSLHDGKRLAWIAYDEAGLKEYLFIADMDSGAERRFPLQRRASRVVTISPDGLRAMVILTPPDQGEGDTPTDRQKRYATYPERSSDGTLLDVVHGTPLPAPAPGDIIEAAYQKDGTLLLRTVDNGTYWVTLLTADGTVAAKTAEPTELHQYILLAYVP